MNSSILELLVFLILLQNCNASSFYEIPLDKIVDPNIHYKWRDLTYTELKEWYSPTELCMLDTNDTVLYPMKIREKYCEKLGKPRGCTVGWGHMGYPCFQPFISRLHFRRGLTGFTDATRPILSETIVNLAKSNVTLVVLGDSTSRQKILAMQCQIQRESHKSKIEPLAFWKIAPCHEKSTIYIRKKGFENVQLNIHQISMGPNALSCLKNETLSTIMHQTKPPKDITNSERMFYIAKNIINHINMFENQRVFVIANMGLWFNDQSLYMQNIPPIVEWLKSVSEYKFNDSRRNIVAWHESLHQHYYSTSGNGYYNKYISDELEDSWKKIDVYSKWSLEEWHDPGCCQSISNHSKELDWRNHVANSYLAETKYYHNYILKLPFADATAPLSDMHICHPRRKHDCTHYCVWPLFYQPLWYQMYNVSLYFANKLSF